MKQQSGSKRLSTFARYVVSYMLVLLLALSALFLYMYVYMNREVRAQVISNGINRLSRIAYQHEGYLDNMLNTAEQIGLSPLPAAVQLPRRAVARLRADAAACPLHGQQRLF